jgi:2-isopropylmalate synthase
MVTLAMNMWTQGIDPKLDFHDINKIKDMYERCTKMPVGDRQPYVGKLVFTAFSGSHQDAINKGTQYMRESGSEMWEIPYLPIDPADVGREYEPIIRINSQSGKGGAAYIMQQNFGYDLPKAMHTEFGAIVQKESDRVGKELLPQQIFDLFDQEYLSVPKTYQLERHSFQEDARHGDASWVTFDGEVSYKGHVMAASGEGTGPIDAFFNALHDLPEGKIEGYQFVDYKEHAISSGSDTQAVCYIHLKDPKGQDVFGVGKSHNISRASLRAILCAINRSVRQQ